MVEIEDCPTHAEYGRWVSMAHELSHAFCGFVLGQTAIAGINLPPLGNEKVPQWEHNSVCYPWRSQVQHCGSQMLTGENLEQTPADEAELIQTAAGVAAEIALHGQEVMRYSASVEYSDHWIFNRLLRKQGVKPTYVRWLEYLDNARRTIENYTSFQKIGECARDILKQHSERPPVLYQKEVYEAIGGLLGYPEPMVWDEWRKVWNEKV